ncbi:hypothetical protein BH92_15340 [Rhodococcoides fascians A21d2]|uniref:hypothetical protein n=1 Tax=Rhodococcoides fascians TaxID=1828 RepID=UPI000A772B61|nr:hypothetical protein [Rhodococcus fascians]QII01063.1 hypothetical protein BH92_15340 [Rhodococcus fascians A21d2]
MNDETREKAVMILGHLGYQESDLTNDDAIVTALIGLVEKEFNSHAGNHIQGIIDRIGI